MKTILVPIDFSDGSLAALTTADKLADSLDASITLLHVVHRTAGLTRPDTGLDPTLQEIAWDGLYDDEETLELARTEMTRFLVRTPDTRHPKQVIFRAGLPADAIVDAADAIDAAMVVMSTHGRRGLARVFLGSTAEEVVRRSDCPVLTVKPHASLDPHAMLG
ncbi:MAG: universal stress protein [Myxococcales bacterium]|nr:universal stress protein [Myxococcales bacterium]